MEKDIVLGFGEHLGIRSRFKRALLNHPGIFYISSKINTHTVVLKEGYKRGLLVENHPLMSMRNRYIHLMHSVKEDSGKAIVSVPGGSRNAHKKKQQQSCDSKGKKEGEEEDDGEVSLSDSMEDEDENETEYQKSVASHREGRRMREKGSNGEAHIRKPEIVRSAGKTRERVSTRFSRRMGNHGGHNDSASARKMFLFDANTEDEDENEKGYRNGVARDRGRRREKRANGEGHVGKPERSRSPRVSRRAGNRGGNNDGESTREIYLSDANTKDEDENKKGYRNGSARDRGRRREKHLNGEGHVGKPERSRSPRVSRRAGNKDGHNVKQQAEVT